MKQEDFMRRAIELASRGGAGVSPNPLVGAVLVHEGRIIGEGYHAHYGNSHAEVDCLASVLPEDQPLISQSAMYVSLEPCSHQGRQPPCADRLIKERIKKVVIAVQDPFPAVSGKGIALLRDAGIEIELGVREQEARWMCRRFLTVQEHRRPYIILKWAESADGFIAPSDGSRYQFSNSFSQTLVHKWRTEESSIMVGYNTARSDNPRLTARYWNGPQPLRIALDRKLQLPATHFLRDGSTLTWIVNELEDSSGDTRLVRMNFDGNLLTGLLQHLLQAGRNSLIVEGGAALLNSFISEGLWDEARVFQTPQRLDNGIKSPMLPQADLMGGTAVGDDTLQFFLRKGSSFTCAAGTPF